MYEGARRVVRLPQLIRFLILATLLFAHGALAASETDPERLVLLIAERADDPFMDRIRAELVTIGFVIQQRANDTPLEQAARETNAIAAIRILPNRLGVEVWMADQMSGRSLLRQVIVDESAGGPNQSLIAVQTAELLRTSLLSASAPAEAAPASPPPASTPPASPPSALPAAAPTVPPSPAQERPAPATPNPRASSVELEPTAGLQAALGALYSPGGATSALQLWVSLERSLNPHMALALDLSAPLSAGSLSGPEGSTRVGTYLAGGVFLVQGRSKDRRFYFNAGLGLAALRIALDSEANAPLVNNSSSVITAATYLRSDVALELASWLRLGARGTFGVSFERVEVRFAGNDAGSWGRPFAGAFFLAEVPWR